EDYMCKRLFLLFILLVPNFASAQVGTTHGTVVVFNWSNDELIIAADSKGTHVSGSVFLSEPDYSQCKITTFNNEIVFTLVNASSYTANRLDFFAPSWNAESTFRSVVSAERAKTGDSVSLRTIADKWADATVSDLRTEYTFHPKEIAKLAAGGL